ncbi:hypothetical protein EJ02DRAFT_295040, partial [Clathrospora elynae]
LRVTVVAAYGLYKRDLLGKPNTFVVVTINGKQPCTTRVAKRTLDPHRNETFDL